MRTPAMRTPRRGQRGSRGPTPLPSRPVRGGPRITEKPSPTRSGPYGGRVPKRVKETLSPIKKTPPNTGTSSKNAVKAPTQQAPAITGSRAAAMRRRKRSGGLAGALRRARRR